MLTKIEFNYRIQTVNPYELEQQHFVNTSRNYDNTAQDDIDVVDAIACATTHTFSKATRLLSTMNGVICRKEVKIELRRKQEFRKDVLNLTSQSKMVLNEWLTAQ